MSGIVIVYKPRGWTSFDVVKKIKKIYNTPHVGHLGTLDPMAEGVLMVAVGKATKLFDFYLTKDKEYIATFKAGEETDTLDAEGEVIKTSSKKISSSDVKAIFPNFLGEIFQTPPRYSAIKINGKRAYELARKNIEFDIQPKKINIYNLELLSTEENLFEIKIVCSAGTYIRSLGRDMFAALDSCATMVKLVRTRAGNFDLSKALSIEQIEQSPLESLMSLDKVLSNLERVELDEKYKKQISNGVQIKNITKYKENDEFTLFVGSEFFGIATIQNSKIVLKVNLYEGE